MTKRKIDCSVNDLIVDYLEKRNCKKTLKLLQENKMGFTERKLENENLCEKFMNYLIGKQLEKEKVEDELGFEINFGAYQPAAKVSLVILIRQKCSILTIATYNMSHI